MAETTSSTTTTSTVTPPPAKPPRRGFSLWGFVAGAVLILWGLQMLASQYGWNWSLQIDPMIVWPMILILVGLSLITRGRAISSIVGAILALAVIGVIVVVGITQPSGVATQNYDQTISIPRESSVTSAAIAIDMGAIDMKLRGGTGSLIAGRYESNSAQLVIESGNSETAQSITLHGKQKTSRPFWLGHYKNSVDLTIADDLPIELAIDSGAASLDLDLSAIQLKKLTVDAGASSMDLKLGDTLERSAVDISSGASSIDISIPKTVPGVRLLLDAGLSGKTLPAEFKNLGNGVYETAAYAGEGKKLDLNIDAGASSIDIYWQ